MSPLMTVQELQSVLHDDNLVLLDCRFYLTDLAKGRYVFEEGHIPGAVFVDVHRQLAGVENEHTGRHPLPEAATFAQQLKLWGIHPKSNIVVYDDMGGAIAARAWWMLEQLGLSVKVLDGGLPAWLRAGYDTVAGASVLPSPAKVDIEVAFPWAVSESDVIQNFEMTQFCLVDARAQDRFSGENETMDPVAGHIPGAINRFFGGNMTADGVFKAPVLLAQEWQALLDGEQDIVHYCGSGVTACHNVLALAHAGMVHNRVYVGSWSQWSKRMQRLLEQAQQDKPS